MDIEDLKGVVKRAAQGDPVAAGLLFDRYYPRVLRYARSRLRHPAEAEDVAAESFARVLVEIRRFRWRGAGFEAWLFRITSNLVVDCIRRRGSEDLSAQSLEGASRDDGPEYVLLAAETAGELSALLDDLPGDQREVLLLRFVAELDTYEAARVMGKTPNAIRQLQFRALRNLRGVLGAMEDER